MTKPKKATADWSQLPPELLMEIATPNSMANTIRFRSVCKSWRNSLLVPDSGLFSVADHNFHLPYIENYHGAEEHPLNRRPKVRSYLLQNSVCCLQQDATSIGWLVNVVENSELLRKKSIGDPILQINRLRDATSPPSYKSLRLRHPLHITIFQKSRFYDLVEHHEWSTTYTRVLVFLDSGWSGGQDRCVLTRSDNNENLRLWQSGDGKYWTKIGHPGPGGLRFNDIATCDGRFFAVDEKGVVFFINTSTGLLVQCSPPLLVSSSDGPMKAELRFLVYGRDFWHRKSKEKAELSATLEALIMASKSNLVKDHGLIIEIDPPIIISWFCHPDTGPLEYISDFSATEQPTQSITQVTFHLCSTDANNTRICITMNASDFYWCPSKRYIRISLL